MFDTYNRDFDDKLESVINAYDAFMKELRELRENYHEPRKDHTGGVDLTEVGYTIEELETFLKDTVKPIRDQHQELIESDYDDYVRQHRLTVEQMGLKI